jgi:hypothetical protein
MYPFLSFLSFMYVPSNTLTPWIGFQSPACNDYGRYCSSIVTSLLISDSRYWYIESALFTGLNASPLWFSSFTIACKTVDAERLWFTTIFIAAISLVFLWCPVSWRKLDIFRENFSYFFYLWKNSRQNTFAGLFMVMFKKESSQRALSFNAICLALCHGNNRRLSLFDTSWVFFQVLI